MKIATGVAALSALALAGAAHAQVTATLTSSTATVDFRPGPPPGGSYDFSGANLDGFLNDLSPSGATYNSRNELDGGEILFVNGNVTSGSFAGSTTFTSLKVDFTNDERKTVPLVVHSTLLPAGFGLFIADKGCSAGKVIACVEAVGADGFKAMPLNQFGGSEDDRIAFTSFDFNISSGDYTLFSLSASITLRYDFQTGENVIDRDIDQAAFGNRENFLGLRNFGAFKDTDTALAYVWDATDVELFLGEFAPGETRSLTYTTSVTTFTRSFGDGTNGIVAFGEFGDPIGRGGAIPPPATLTAGRGFADLANLEDPRDPSDPLRLQRPSLFTLPAPVYSNGVIGVLSAVPEPGTWALLLTGFGLSGAALRRRRAAAAA